MLVLRVEITRRRTSEAVVRECRTLPLELVTEILSWLPVKYLFQFRCVSKTWLLLLTTDYNFINLHIHRSIQSNHCTLFLRKPILEKVQYYYAEPTKASLSSAIEFEFPVSMSSPRHCKIVGIQNGLLFLAYEYIFTKPNFYELYVWNPLTKEHISIPCPPVPSHTRKIITGFGFGFLQSTNEYKVVRVVSPLDPVYSLEIPDFVTHVSVYTLSGTGLWKNLDDILYNINVNDTAIVNGSIHWLATRRLNYRWNLIVSFDIKDEVFQEMPLPENFHSCEDDMHVGELGRLLCMFRISYSYEVVVWAMKEYGVVGSWTKLFKVGRLEIGWEFDCLVPIGVANSGEIIVRKSSEEFLFVNPNTNSIRRLKKFWLAFGDAHTYIGSLVSPNVINGISQSGTSMI